MPLITRKTPQSVEFRDTGGKLCGNYHYEDAFKSFFRGLYTPGGKDVVACPPPEHPHHKGLQFGLCTSDVNFWEEDEAHEPAEHKLSIGAQRTTKLELLSPADGIGFTQEVRWETGGDCIFNETRKVSVKEATGAYVWTWETTLTAAQEVVKIVRSVWPAPGYCGWPGFGYCGLGLRLAHDLFRGGKVLPSGTKCGSTPTSVSFQGEGAKVMFEQDAEQANALFVSTYEGEPPFGPDGPGFAYMCLVPTPRDLRQGESLAGRYIITVSDV